MAWGQGGDSWGQGQRQAGGLLCPQGWVLVDGEGESCCHCALPGEWVWGWQRSPQGRRLARSQTEP